MADPSPLEFVAQSVACAPEALLLPLYHHLSPYVPAFDGRELEPNLWDQPASTLVSRMKGPTRMAGIQTNLRLSQRGKDLLETIADAHGITNSQVGEIAIRLLAKRLGMWKGADPTMMLGFEYLEELEEKEASA